MKIWRMRISCWIPKAINTHSGCVILIAFPLQQCLHESPSMLPLRTLPVLLYYHITQLRYIKPSLKAKKWVGMKTSTDPTAWYFVWCSLFLKYTWILHNKNNSYYCYTFRRHVITFWCDKIFSFVSQSVPVFSFVT